MTGIVTPQAERPDWRNRTLILLLVGAVAAWLVWWIMDMSASYSDRVTNPSVLAGRYALATGISVTAIAFGFGLERVRIGWTVAFALALGLMAGLILWWNNDGQGIWNWSGASLFLAVAIAVPLFQVARDEGRLSFPYTQIHGHAWTNVVLWFACWAFAGISMLLTVLMAELFKLIGITFLHDLLEKGWFPALVIGGAFGAALGMFRDLDHVVRLLQRVVTSVLSVLAPVLGVGLVIFLLSLPFTGLHTLWEATRNTTPILITCVIGALILINALIGHGPEDEATNLILRWGAMALGVSVLPLAIVAAIATGLRIQQYGFTPDRLWALVFVVLASVYGVVYLAALIRKRQNWAEQVRPDNIRLAFATLAVALLLATPLVGFNSISANSQVARLNSGKVSVDQFDWAAVAFDFGEPGRKAVEELTRSTDAAVAKRAFEVAKAGNRWTLRDDQADKQLGAALIPHLRVLPEGVELPVTLRDTIAKNDQCVSGGCTIFFVNPGSEAQVVYDACFVPTINSTSRDGGSKSFVEIAPNCHDPVRYVLIDGKWFDARTHGVSLDDATEAKRRSGFKAGDFEVRTVTRRQVFVGGVPIDGVFE